MSELEYRCPVCHGITDNTMEHCPICNAPLSHAILHIANRESIFPEPILVRHAEDTPAIPMDPTAHMHENTAPSVTEGIYGEAETSATAPTARTEADTPPSEAETAANKPSQRHPPLRYVIVGGGIAGLTAAESIRAADPTGEITLLCGESVPPYRRPTLSRDLSACATREGPALRSPAELQEKRIRVLCDATVMELDVDAKTVRTVAETVPYDRCILAVGSAPRLPNIPGQSLPGVLMLRELSDGRALLRRLPYLSHAVLVGGGLAGVELALTLAREGCRVTLVEEAPTLLHRLIHADAADLLARTLTKAGISLRLGVACTHIHGRDRVNSVVTEDGKSIPCDGVILCCGARPRTALSCLAGLPNKKGVPVNTRMETPLPDLYACGDCIHLPLPSYTKRNWQLARETGHVAGANAAGQRIFYQPHPIPISLSVADRTLCVVGDCGKDADVIYHIVTYQSGDGRSFSQFFFRDEGLVGATVLAETVCGDTLAGAVERHVSLSDFLCAHAFRATGEASPS